MHTISRMQLPPWIHLGVQLPVEMVDMEVKVKTMQGIHTFRRVRTSQVIRCNPWSTKLHPYPSLIQKMKTYLEFEERLGPKSRLQTANPAATDPSHNKPVHTNPSCNWPNQAPTPWLGNPHDPRQMSLTREQRTMIAKQKVQGKGIQPAYTF